MNKHNEHVMSWLSHLAAEAKQPGTSLTRVIQIFSTIAQYSKHQ